MVASMRNVVVGATVAATSVSFVSAGKPALFQATAGPQKFCSDPNFKTVDGNSFTMAGTPDSVSANNPSGYFLVPQDKYDKTYNKPLGSYMKNHGNFEGFSFLVVPGMCVKSPNEQIFTDARCTGYNACPDFVPGDDDCGVTDDTGKKNLKDYITQWGKSNWEAVDKFECCPYDQVFGRGLADEFAHWLSKSPTGKRDAGGVKDDNYCENLYKAFLSDDPSKWDPESAKLLNLSRCKTAFVAHYQNFSCTLKPASLG